MSDERLAELCEKLAREELSPAEEEELAAALASDTAARATVPEQVFVHRTLGQLRPRSAYDPGRVMAALPRGSRAQMIMERVHRVPVARPRRWFYPVAAAAAVVMVVGAGKVILERGAHAPSVTAPPFAMVESASRASVVRRSRVLPAATGTPLQPGDGVETGVDGSATVQTQGDVTLALGAGTRLDLDEVVSGRRVLGVARGTLQVTAASQAPGAVLTFATPHARVTVVGTRILLSVLADRTRLEVSEGRALFESLVDGKTIEVGAGQQALAVQPPATAASTSAPALTASPDASTRTVILSFDFEDGAMPTNFSMGQVAEGPAREGSRYAMMGSLVHSVTTARTQAWGVSLKAPTLFHVSGKQVLSFDYWLDPASAYMSITYWNHDRSQNYGFFIWKPVHGSWGHAEIRLADFKGALHKDRPPQDGDRITSLSIFGGVLGGKPLFVDNIKLAE